MESVRSAIVIFLTILGLFFFIVGTIGLIRMPDAFCRMHATTKCDTLGAGFLILALIVYRGFDITSIKLVLVIVFMWITNPTAAHSIAKVEYNRKQLQNQVVDKKGVE